RATLRAERDSIFDRLRALVTGMVHEEKGIYDSTAPPAEGQGHALSALTSRSATSKRNENYHQSTRRVQFLAQTGVNAQTFGGLTEPLVSCPQKRGRIDKDRGY